MEVTSQIALVYLKDKQRAWTDLCLKRKYFGFKKNFIEDFKFAEPKHGLNLLGWR